MPVHLGSMGESIKTVIARNAGRMQPGDVYVLNDPYNGGTHLPDVTVVMPVFADAGDEDPVLRRRARPPRRHRRHHARLDAARLAHRAKRKACSSTTSSSSRAAACARPSCARCSRRRAIRRATPTRTSPTCAPRSRPARRAAKSLSAWSRTSAWPRVRAYMRHVQDNAEESVRRAIGALTDGDFDYAMDGGAVIRVRIAVDRATAERDGRLHRYERRARDATSTRRRPSCTPRCSTSSAPWSTTTSR